MIIGLYWEKALHYGLIPCSEALLESLLQPVSNKQGKNMELKSLRYEKNEGVATIIKSNPPQFGMTLEVLMEMKKTLKDAERDSDISVIVITAEEGFHMGATVFGEVGDKDWKLSPLEFKEVSQVAHRLFRYIETLEKPVIGVAEAGAVGGGLENLHACDFVIAAETATFSQPEVTLGLNPGWGASQRIPRMIGWRKAKEFLLMGIEVTGLEAERMGLISRAVPVDDVQDEVDRFCDRLKICAPVAWGYTKLAMNKTWEMDHRSGLDWELEAWGMTNSEREFNADVFEQFLKGEQPTFKKRRKKTNQEPWLKD